MNNFSLVGRLTADPVVKDLDSVKVSNITVAVQRPFKINLSLWNRFIPIMIMAD